jgi:hypothetical protein
MQNTIKLLILSTLLTLSLHAEVDCEQTYKVQSFAKRFYVEVLDRQPDNAGLDGWTNSLTSREKTGADVAAGFVFSVEFIAKNKNNEEFVTILYKAFFNRLATQDVNGFSYWTDKLNAGESREEVANGFIYSAEFANLAAEYGIKAYEGAAFTSLALTNFVKRFYSVVLGREADSAGLADWTNQLSTGTATGADIAFGFVFSAEYNEASKTNTEYLNTLYLAFFDRTPDAGGFAGWLAELENGTSRQDVLDNFLHSQEFINLTNSFGILAFVGAPTPDASDNVAPLANAGTDQALNFGETVSLDGSASTDSDGSIVCAWWATEFGLISETLSYASSSSENIKEGVHNIRLTVVDNSGVSTSDSMKVTIVDVPPTFISSSSNTVAENQISAINVVATDAGGAVTYSINGGDSALFSIDSSTGAISFNTAPDYETRDTYTFTVTATDGAGHEVTQDVTIHISDVVEFQAPKKTGQTKSYNEAGTEVLDNSIKDDGFYQAGTAPSYSRDDTTDIVTDHITNLQWADDVASKTVAKRWLTTTNYDICRGLNGQTQDTSKCTDTSGDTATTYCSSLSLGGHSDWRLPSIDELMYIADRSKSNPSIDTTAFENVVSNLYWSSSTVVGYESNAWVVYFNDGYDGWNNKSNSSYVRCVRVGQP